MVSARVLVYHLFVVLNHILSSVNELAEDELISHDEPIYSSSIGHSLICVVYSLFHIMILYIQQYVQ